MSFSKCILTILYFIGGWFSGISWFGSSKSNASTESYEDYSVKQNSSHDSNMFSVATHEKAVLSESNENLNKAQNDSNDEDMTSLIKLQGSNGIFEVTKEDWETSVFKKYLGTIENVTLSCPNSIDLKVWVTALAMEILEVHMNDKRDLWELVAEKSKKYILKEMGNNQDCYRTLQNNAEEYVNKQKE